jgi:hypothetical protein
MSFRSLAIVVLILSPLAVGAADEEHPFKAAKVGDYAKYSSVLKKAGLMTVKTTRTQTVTVASEKELTIKTVVENDNKDVQSKATEQEQKIDLTKPFDPGVTNDVAPGLGALKWEKQKDGKEKVKVGNKEYDCTWTSYTAMIPEKAGVEGEMKVWLSKDIPFVVKRTLTMKASGGGELNYSTDLIEFGSKK